MKKIIPIFITLLLLGCASIPRSTVDLSVKLDEQLQALKIANESMINIIFTEKEEAMITYINDVAFPEYLKKLFKDPNIDTIWQEMLASDDMLYRYETTIWLNKNIHKKYLETKESLLEPIQEERKLVMTKFKEEFESAIKMNNTITRNISSAKDIDEVYAKYASKFVDINKLDSIVTISILKVDKGLDKGLDAINTYKENEPKINELINKIK